MGLAVVVRIGFDFEPSDEQDSDCGVSSDPGMREFNLPLPRSAWKPPVF
jgi:hypothetical protein